MVDRQDIGRLTERQHELVAAAVAELQTELAKWDLTNIGDVREALFQLIPMLVDNYGNAAAAQAAEWYEEMRPGTGYTARTVASIPTDEIYADLGFHAKDLDAARVAGFAHVFTGALQRHITYSSRETIARNVEVDPLRPRFARVPMGANTCAWCDMLSSRGFAYRSRETAGEVTRFHAGDDCQIVPEWEANQAHIEGYDPDAAYERYLGARAELEAEGINPTDKAVARRLRDMHPDLYTDGRAIPSIITDADAGWPIDQFHPVGLGRWRHVLDGHAPSTGTRSRFPEGMTNYDIARIIRDVITAPDVTRQHREWEGTLNYYRRINGRVYLVGTTILNDGRRRVNTAFPPENTEGIL